MLGALEGVGELFVLSMSLVHALDLFVSRCGSTSLLDITSRPTEVFCWVLRLVEIVRVAFQTLFSSRALWWLSEA